MGDSLIVRQEEKSKIINSLIELIKINKKAERKSIVYICTNDHYYYV